MKKMQTTYPLKIQAIRSRGQQPRLYVSFPLALAAAIQELTTNAAKYGALSIPTGKIAISWAVDERDLITLDWRELDGPAVKKPERRGFGTKLIQDVLAADSGWKVKVEYLPTGVHCTLTFDARH